MRKLLLFVLSLFITSSAYAGTVNVGELSRDSDITIGWFNDMVHTFENVINGNIESVNIKDATITVDDMAASSSPAQREGDHFNAYTKTGMLPADSADKTSNISAGTSYVESDTGLLYRVVTAATSKTYTATKDTWVYIDKNGAFQYTEVAVGGARPTTPSDSLLLATVTTDGTEITVVTDRRTLSISLGSSEDYLIKGFEIHCDNVGGKASADAGVVYHGTTRIKKTSATSLTVGTAADWWDGAVDSGTEAFYYVGIDSTGGIKFLGNNPPNRADTAGNTAGKKRYWYDGSKYWRLIGQVKVNASNKTLAQSWYGSSENVKIMWNIPQLMSTTLSLGVWTDGSTLAKGDCSTLIPATSNLAVFGLYSFQNITGAGVWIRPNGSTWSINEANGATNVTGGGISYAVSGQRLCATDSSQKINYYCYPADTAVTISVEGYEFDR